MGTLADVLNRRRVGAAVAPQRTSGPAPRSLPASALVPQHRSARGPSRMRSRTTRPAASTLPPAPPPRRALSDRELYQTWLRLTLVPDTPAIVEWPNVYLAAHDLGLTRLGRGHYRPEQWRKAVQRLVREGGAIPFWWRTKGRPPRVLTTQQHLAAWAIAGYHLRLGRRRRT